MVSVRIQVRSARSAIAAQQLQIFVRQRPAYPNGSSQTYIEHRWSQGGSDAGDVLDSLIRGLGMAATDWVCPWEVSAGGMNLVHGAQNLLQGLVAAHRAESQRAARSFESVATLRLHPAR